MKIKKISHISGKETCEIFVIKTGNRDLHYKSLTPII